MGYDSSDHWTSKTVVVRELLEQARREYTLLAHQTAKSGLWMAVRNGQGHAFIIFDLIERERVNGRVRYYVKDMCESMHPFYYDCPLHFLALAPEASAEWRANVRLHHGVAP